MMIRAILFLVTLVCSINSIYGQVPERLIFAGNNNYPPLLFEVDGQPAGLTVELARAIFDEAGVDVKIELKDWAEAQVLAKNQQIDGLLQINKTEERQAYFDFSAPVLTSEFSIFTASDRNEIYELKHLSGLRVGTEKSGFAKNLIVSNPEIEAVVIGDWVTAFKKIQKGEIDAIVTEKLVGEYVLSQNQILDIRVSPIPITLSNTYIALPRGNEELLKAINSGISTIELNGRRQEILNRWQGSSVLYITQQELEDERLRYLRWTIYTVGVLVFLLLIILIAWQRIVIKGKNRQLELITLNEKLTREANVDELTQLPNRRAITLSAEVHIALAQRQKQAFCVAMLDIDHFKQVNDVYGHDTGDKVLQIFAEKCNRRSRKTDMLGRWGGEEFVLLMPGTNLHEGLAACEACRQAVEKLAIDYHDKTLQITMSIGLAECLPSDESLTQILKRADEALYTAKKQGRNKCVVAGAALENNASGA